MINQIKRVVSEFLSNLTFAKYGHVSAYNPNNYTVKVMLLPEQVETGFIPLATIWVGNNLGAVFGPAIGDSVKLDFIDGSVQAMVVNGRFFNNTAAPPVVQSGQAAFVDSQGSYIRLNNDGSITMGAPNGITTTTPLLTQNGNATVTGNVVVGSGATGSFTTPSGDTVMVQDGIVTNIF
jgi:hypothetical protein